MKALTTIALLAAMAGPALALNLEKAGIEDPAKESGQTAKPTKADPAPSADVKKCVDDERLASIEEWAGKGIKGQKVTVTPETYLSLDPEIRGAIGSGEVVVCPNIGIKKGGLPIRKIEVPFYSLMTELKNAAESDKPDAALRALVKTFKAAPLPPEEVKDLALQRLSWDEKIGKKIFSVLKLVEYVPNSWRSPAILLFTALGGRASEKKSVIIASYQFKPEDTPDGTLLIPYEHRGLYYQEPELCKRLTEAGLNAEVR